MTADEYTNQKTGFNTPNGSWIFGLTYKPDDKNITVNDGDSSWGSQMIVEVSESECGYSANYVGPKRIDSHLFSTIPATDFRRMCWVDPAIDALGSRRRKSPLSQRIRIRLTAFTTQATTFRQENP